MTQNRQPPAFQEYASNMLARIDFRTLSLLERGLLYTMRLECWVNINLPASPEKLAKVLGESEADISSALPSLKPFLSTDGVSLSCPELVDYRAHIDGIREKQRSGGQKGVKAKRDKAESSHLEVDRKVSSKAKSNTDQSKTTQPLKQGLSIVAESFVAEMESAESANISNDYRKASDGY